MGFPSVKPYVLNYYAERPGLQIDVDTVATDLGLTVNQVKAAMYNLVNKDKLSFVPIMRDVWEYRPTKGSRTPVAASSAPVDTVSVPLTSVAVKRKAEGRIFEEMGVNREGRSLIRDIDSREFFVAEPL